jgi:2-oxoglutarate dehydrogenase complex dehydrogenase (E1) component-like enzyme
MKSRDANSNIEEFDEGLRFKRIIADKYKDQAPDEKIKRVVLCSG